MSTITEEDQEIYKAFERYISAIIKNTLRDSGLISSPDTEQELADARSALDSVIP